MVVLLVVLAVAFAWSMGAHYTGACMGMPHALRAVIAALLGFLLTRLFDLVPGVRNADSPSRTATVGGVLATGLVAVGGIASFAMGANDVSNATGSLIGTGLLTPLWAGLLGGAGLALGVLTWGRPLLEKVAFDIVTVDRPMATAAQLVQGLVVLVAVGFGYFTSMNQALVGGMVGAGAARGRHAVHRASILGILRGWLIGPATGFALGYLAALAVAAVTGAHTLLIPA